MKVIISTGGTGGHIFPALRIKEKLLQENFDTILLIGGKAKIPLKEKRTVIKAAPFMGKNFPRAFINTFINIYGTLQALKFLTRNPFPVVATGSYASFPVLASAFIKKIPYFLLEQNSIPGRVNRMFSGNATLNFISFEKAVKHLKGRKIFTGNPLREFKEVGRKDARKKLGIELDRKVILIFGGSQGSKFLNDLTVQISKEMKNFKFILISGVDKYDSIKNKIQDNVIAFPFYNDMETLYSASDIAITRAGGVTLYELLYFGLPSLLIPFPHASDNHQLYNAIEVKEKYGFFEVLEEKDVKTQKVIDILKKLFKKQGKKVKFLAENKITYEIKKYMEGKGYAFKAEGN